MQVETGNLSYVVGPVVAVVAVVLLVLFTRWAFSGDGERRSQSTADDGLLVRVATLSRHDSALALRALLSDAGIRSTVRRPAAHRAEVLVFPEDAGRALTLAASFTGRS